MRILKLSAAAAALLAGTALAMAQSSSTVGTGGSSAGDGKSGSTVGAAGSSAGHASDTGMDKGKGHHKDEMKKDKD
jgi:hypothetical protein